MAKEADKAKGDNVRVSRDMSRAAVDIAQVLRDNMGQAGGQA